MGLEEDVMGRPRFHTVPRHAGDFDTRGPTSVPDTDYTPSCVEARSQVKARMHTCAHTRAHMCTHTHTRSLVPVSVCAA